MVADAQNINQLLVASQQPQQDPVQLLSAVAALGALQPAQSSGMCWQLALIKLKLRAIDSKLQKIKSLNLKKKTLQPVLWLSSLQVVI